MSDQHEIIVVGGGIAGMTAALEMGRLGYGCTILEATPAAGGRTQSIRGGDIVVETDSQQACTFDADPDLYFNPGHALHTPGAALETVDCKQENMLFLANAVHD